MSIYQPLSYSEFSMKKVLSGVPFWFRYVFWWFFFFLLPWFAFSVPFHEDILIFPFSNGIFVIFVLFQVAHVACAWFFWVSEAMLTFFSVWFKEAFCSLCSVAAVPGRCWLLFPLAPFSLALCWGSAARVQPGSGGDILGCLMAAPAASPSYFKMFIYIK